MYLIVGLGNPEEDYKNTRHNMGFDTINKIAEELNIKVEKKKFNGLYAQTAINGEKVILLKPQTFMNLSGDSVVQFVNFYKIPLENMIVIYDDLDIEEGKIKIRKSGGPGTHNGMKSICSRVNSENFPRVRVGIGSKNIPNGDLVSFVIGYIDKSTRELLDASTTKAKDAVFEILKNGIDYAMNKFN